MEELHTMKYGNFNDAEALKIAISVEEEGSEFYSTIMNNTKDVRIKEVFSKLASDEKEHISQFQKIYAEISPSTSPIQGCEEYTIDLYLKHLIDTGIFSRKGEAKRLAGEVKTDIDALKIGIQAEKDAILYYSEAAENTKHSAGKRAFELLINEEKEHLRLLAEQLTVLKNGV
jgi:rubrerythrin